VQHADRPARVADRLTHVVHLLGDEEDRRRVARRV
jgi:hypothetical protein